MSYRGNDIVIIGGGMSAHLLLLQLMRLPDRPPLRITVIERTAGNRMGDAFCSDRPYHLLNVPVARMSAYADKPDDLQRWLAGEGYNADAGAFIPRCLYREYIRRSVEEMIREKAMAIDFIHREACDIDMEERTVVLDNGETVPAGKIVLALGNFPPAAVAVAGGGGGAAVSGANAGYARHAGYYGSAWDAGLFAALQPHQRVLILGSGLTMVDMAMMLHERQHEGPITALSTHGYIPYAHEPVPAVYPGFYEELEGQTELLKILRVVRKHIRKAAEMQIGWRAVIDSLRPFTHELWGGLPVTEKRSFMEHLRHIWGIARHRMPPENAAVLKTMLSSGRLSIVAGRIRSIVADVANGFLLEYSVRGSANRQWSKADVIINCMGPASNYYRIDQPLIKNLLKKQLIQTDDLQLGINCSPAGSVIGKNGRPGEFLYTIGPPARGILWESTAIPDIRTQAHALARMLVPLPLLAGEAGQYSK